MNDLIRKFAKKSGFSLDQDNIYTAKLEHLPITENMEKFAEFVIKECAELATKEYNNYGGLHGNDLLEHFGVEE